MDAKPNEQPINSEPTPRNSFPAWLKVNGYKLLTMAAIVGVICYFLNPLDFLLGAIGLGAIIFIHELGHFLAAKACGVYVRTFSIGFGPAWPFCKFQYGETNYKLGMIPLGGYVAMAGETTGEVDPEDAVDDPADDANPRNFKNKPVWQRMIIISAGVIMNFLLSAICFVAVYLHGVKEVPAVVQGIDPGAAAWQAGIRPGTTLEKINSLDHPWYLEITPEVSSTNKGSSVHLETLFKGTANSLDVEPIRAEAALYPQLGLSMPQSVQLAYFRRDPQPPFEFGSPAQRWNATAEQTSPETTIRPGDTIVGMSDPADPSKITPLEQNWNGMPGYNFDYKRRVSRLIGKPILLELQRLDSTEKVVVTLPPQYRQDTGLRMKIGKVVALRANSPASAAGVNAQKIDGDRELEPGDRIVEIAVTEANGQRSRYCLDRKSLSAKDAAVKLLDPLRMPFELNRWADSIEDASKRVVTITVHRNVDHTEKPVELAPMLWDDSYREDAFYLSGPGTPVALGGLGLAYRVSNEVNEVIEGSPAATAGMQSGDTIKETRIAASTYKWHKPSKQYSPDTPTAKWEPVKSHQWAFVDYKVQVQAPHSFDVKVERGGETLEKSLQAGEDTSWGVPMTGLLFQREFQYQTAKDIPEALHLGFRRVVRSIKTNYQGLYGMIVGRISPLTMSGPITLATMTYKIAGEDIWTLLLFVGLISTSIAVVNFLPIPVLDGGHMVFLLYESVFRRPAPVLIQNVLTIAGLVIVLGLMVFTIGLDIWKNFFAG